MADTREKAAAFMRLNGTGIVRVLRGDRLVFRFPDTEEDRMANDVEKAVKHFDLNNDVLPDGIYLLIAKSNPKSNGKAAEFHFTYSIENERPPQQAAVSGANPAHFEELLNARMQAQQEVFNRQMETFRQEQERQKLRDEIAELKRQMREKPAQGIDKFIEAVNGIASLGQAGAAPRAVPAVPAVAGPPAAPPAAPPEPQPAADNDLLRVQKALFSIQDALGAEMTVEGLEKLAAMSADSPEMLRGLLKQM